MLIIEIYLKVIGCHRRIISDMILFSVQTLATREHRFSLESEAHIYLYSRYIYQVNNETGFGNLGHPNYGLNFSTLKNKIMTVVDIFASVVTHER